ncbi:MAG: hypothetical protein H0X67_17235 [Acidobacteria bacterium]|nr:hypothetical protein [Acidobacteriota bacterium]
MAASLDGYSAGPNGKCDWIAVDPEIDVAGLTYWTTGRAGTATPPRPDVHLLPIYEEYLMAYRDRVAVPHGPGTIGSAPGR